MSDTPHGPQTCESNESLRDYNNSLRDTLSKTLLFDLKEFKK